jgi:hypothetical protein
MKLHGLRWFGCVVLIAAGCSSAMKKGGGGDTGGSGDEETGGSSPTGGVKGTGGAKATGGSGTGGASTGGSGGAEGGQGGSVSPDAGMSEGGSGGGGNGGVSGTHSKMLKLDTTAAGAAVMGDVPKYPVAVVLNAMNFDFGSAKAKGEDLRFSAEDGTSLPYAIESWDGAAKLAVVWVKVDVKGNAVTNLKMSWGDAGAAAASDSKKVFDVAEGFAGVWHLNEAAANTDGTYKDATANAADAQGVALTATSTADGRLGKGALLVHAMNQWIQVPVEKAKLFDAPDKMTYSIWVMPKSHTVSYQCMLSKGEGSFRIHYVGTSLHVETCAEGTMNGDLCPVNEKTGQLVTPNKGWYHLLAIHDRPKHSIWINGVKDAEVVDDGEPWKSDPTRPMTIGNNASNTGRSFDGFVDEARIMNVAKDANWIKLEYESQKEGQKFVTVPAN